MTSPSGDAYSTEFDYSGLGEADVPIGELRIGGRISSTATNGFTGARGTPVTITWGLVDDGTAIPGDAGDDSSLISMLNGQYGAGPGGVENAPWFRLFEDSFNRWSEVSGITYVYEPNDRGAAIDGTTSPSGQLGSYADVRIGGHPIDGSTGGNTLAYNYYPNHSDMVIDTDNFAFYGNREFDSRRLRNVLMHEAGHGLGFDHVESDNSGQLMEPFISTAFDGPQIDDILAAHRNYGDVYEKGGGNDAPVRATELGELGLLDSWSAGIDAARPVVASTQSDFISIDGATDVDFFKFQVAEPSTVRLVLAQLGPTYNEGPQSDTIGQTPFDASRQNPLFMKLYSSEAGNGIALLSEGTAIGDTRQFINGDVLMPGNDYYVHVQGTVDKAQFYYLTLGLSAVTTIPEPVAATTAVLGLALCGLGGRRRAA